MENLPAELVVVLITTDLSFADLTSISLDTYSMQLYIFSFIKIDAIPLYLPFQLKTWE